MAVAFRSAGTLSGSITDATPGLPAGYAADDIFLLVVASATGQPASAPSGYAAVTNGAQDATGIGSSQALSIFWKRASASESAPTVTDTGDHTIARLFAFSGCATSGDPWDVTAGDAISSASTSVTWPSVTTTVANTLIVNVLARGGDTAVATCSGETNANLTSLTERADSGDTAGAGGGIILLTGEWASTGACGTTTATITNTKQARCTIALKVASTAFAIAGVAAVSATATGALAAKRPVASAATAALTAAGAVSAARPVASAAQIAATATGAALATRPVAATAQAVATATGAVLARRPMAGPAAGLAIATGSVGATRPVAATAQASATATGAMLARRPLAAPAPVTVAATGAIGIGVPVAGAAPISASATGAMSAKRPVASPAQTSLVAVGAMLATRPLSGSATLSVFSSGNIETDTPGSTGARLDPRRRRRM